MTERGERREKDGNMTGLKERINENKRYKSCFLIELRGNMIKRKRGP